MANFILQNKREYSRCTYLKVIENGAIEIKNIAVNEAVQGNGIGTILLQYIIKMLNTGSLKHLSQVPAANAIRRYGFIKNQDSLFFQSEKIFYRKLYKPNL
ncbi:GNAT family N-acetyltransferase [Parafilimonas sp.]|uniref:GNAT family N-acetyltransferase n=1 Tax=Parafilimonas sp. TaxID=1969739 RepID=UPI0039E2F4FC